MYGLQGATATNVTGATAIKASKGRLNGVLVNPTGAVTPTVTVYDNPSAASGNVLFQVKLVSAVPFGLWFGDEGINASTGIYIDATSWTTLGATVLFK